jgi:hypothetical protein
MTNIRFPLLSDLMNSEDLHSKHRKSVKPPPEDVIFVILSFIFIIGMVFFISC